MIMVKNANGTYSQVGFIKDRTGDDIEFIYDKNGNLLFEKGFTREVNGELPLTINAIGKNFKSWSITGNTVQNGTPTPENRVEIKGVGDRTKNLFDKRDATVAGYISASGDLVAGNNWHTTANYIKCSGTISISTSRGLGSSAYISCFSEDKSFLGTVKQGGDGNPESRTLTLLEKTAFIKTCCRDNAKGDYQIEVGSTVTKYEPYGFKIPILISGNGAESTTITIYLPTPLYSGEVLRSDGTVTRSDGTVETVSVPQIPTLNGTTIIDVDTEVKPSIFYGKYKSRC